MKDNCENIVFALCAAGKRYEEYRDNLILGLQRYVPNIDIIGINPDTIKNLLPGVPNDQLPTMARLAIPLMKEFKKYNRVIWVDVDIDIISSRFANILKVETSADGLAAVPDRKQDFFAAYMKYTFPEYDHPIYFNAGVLVMDLSKIDRKIWKNKILSALAEHSKKPFRWKDQDILNAYFDIKEIDARFNYLWKREVDPSNGAYCIHYIGGKGHDMLDEILTLRYQAEKIWQDRCVVISPRHDFIRPWIRSYFSSGNTIPLVIIREPSCEWTEDDFAYCRLAAGHCGGIVFDMTSEWPDDSQQRTKSIIFNSIAKNLNPTSWAWIDDDVEVTARIDECFDYAETSSGFVCTQFYYPALSPDTIDIKHHEWFNSKEQKFCWTSFMLFHGDANEHIVEYFSSLDYSKTIDEDIFGQLYLEDEIWHDGFCDASIRNWQIHCSDIGNIPDNWAGKLLHYTGNANGLSVKSTWANKINTLPLAQFEKNDLIKESIPLEDEKEMANSPIDAVFVIGNGSINGNEELRYALRNLDKHCKFIRNVYICGVCPSWVDKTAVRHLQWPDRFNHAKDANIIDKLRHACEVKGIAKRILFCSDDQFQTRECVWEDFRPRYLRRYASNDRWYEQKHRIWHTRLRNTLEREVQRRQSLGLEANEVFYYQPHIWMPIDRDKFIEYAKWSNYERRDDTIIASGYFNFIDANGFPDQDNPVTFLDGGDKSLPDTIHVAYHDGSYNVAMSILKQMFPDRCRFEIPARSIIHPGRNINSDLKVQSWDINSDMNNSPATKDETSQIVAVMARIRQNPAWHGMLHEVSRAEELRLFGVSGWRVVWKDIIERWKHDTDNGQSYVPVTTARSEDALSILSAYANNPQSMRTISFGPQQKQSRQLMRPDPDRVILRERVHAALRRLSK